MTKNIEKITKTEIINNVSKKSEVRNVDAEMIIDKFLDEIMNCVERGKTVQLTKFGTFSSRYRAARSGVNPQTREKIEVPASMVVGFKAGKEFKDKIAQMPKQDHASMGSSSAN